MPIESSGEIRLRGTASDGRTDINEEINGNATDTDVSLGTLNTVRHATVAEGNTVTGRSMSEMRGYSAFTSALPQTEATGALGESLLFYSNNHLLHHTPSISSNRKTFTWSGWFKFHDAGSHVLFESGDTGGDNYIGLRLNTSNKFYVAEGRPATNGYLATTNEIAIDLSSWYHCVLAVDTRGDTSLTGLTKFRVYVNGIELPLIATNTSLPANQDLGINTSAYRNCVGRSARTDPYADWLNGVIADVKFIDGKQLRPDSFGKLLNGIWIPQAYATSDDTEITSNLIAKYDFIDNANDTSGSATTYNGSASNVTYYRNNYHIADFNGSSSVIEVPSKIPASLDFSISFWFNSTSTYAHSYIFSTKHNSVTNGWWIVFNRTTGAGTINYGEGNGSLNATTAETSINTLGDGDWHHAVVTRATGGIVNIYIDGVHDVVNHSVGSGYMTSSTWHDNLHIGKYAGTNALYYDGYLGEAQVYTDVLTPNEALQQYNATKHKYAYGINGFWLPLNNTSTGSIDSSSNLKLHLDASNSSSYSGSGTNWNDLTSNNNDGTISGANYLSSTNGGVFDFDGSNDYVEFADNTDLRLLGDYTVEGWFNTDALSGDQRIVNKDDAIDHSAGYGIMIHSNGQMTWSHNEGSNENWAISAGIVAGKWYHFVASYSDAADKRYFYLNGKLIATRATTTNLVGENDKLFIGTFGDQSPSGQYFNGKIGGIRIYNKSLTAQEVITNYRATQGNYEQISTVDISGNANSFTTTNIDYTDHIPDEPLNNYATLNQADLTTGGTISEGNLKFASGANGWNKVRTTLAATSGKWYFEMLHISATNNSQGIGIVDANAPNKGNELWGQTAGGIIYYGQFGSLFENGGPNQTYSSTFGSNTRLMCAFDMDAGKIWFGRNGTWIGDPVAGTGAASTTIKNYITAATPFAASYYSGASMSFDFGQHGFTYDPPTGFKALTTSNLSAPTFDPDGVTQDKPSNHFKAVTYQGNGGQQGDDYGWVEGSRAAVFNGSNSVINISSNTLDITQNFSVSGWVNQESSDVNLHIFACTDTNSNNIHFDVNIQPTQNRVALVYNNVAYYPSLSYQSGWNHYAITLSGTTLKTYVNGSPFDTRTVTVASTSGNRQTIGTRLRQSYSSYGSGKIDQVRIYDTALTQANVTTLYEEALDSNISISGLVAHYDMEGNANDKAGSFGSLVSSPKINLDVDGYTSGSVSDLSGNGNTATVTGATYGTDSNGNGYFDLDGSSDYLQISASTDFNSATNFTLEGWFNPDNLTAVDHLFSIYGTSANRKLFLRLYNSSGDLAWQTYNSSGNTAGHLDTSNANARVAANKWNHVAVTHINNGSMEVFVNGVSAGTASSTGINTTGTEDLYIGTLNTYIGTYDFDGKVSDVRFYDSALSSAQVFQNFNASKGSYGVGLDGTLTNVTFTQDKPYGNIDVGFAPDFVWLKSRTLAASHGLYDSVRGAAKWLRTDGTDAEQTQRSNGFLSSFDSNGFSLRDGDSTHATYTDSYETHQEGQDYVAWAWKAGGEAGTNENGTIDSQVSANTDAGFSIVSWTGDGSDATVGHGLSKEPELVITKGRANLATYNSWITYHKDLSTNHHLYLNTTDNQQNGIGDYFRDAAFSNTVIGLGNDIYGPNVNNTTMIAYCFHSVDGFSKIGSYTGNASTTDGPFVYTGFKPAWIMIKQSSASGTRWIILDNARRTENPATEWLSAEYSGSEQTDSSIALQFMSNGFKVGNPGTSNASLNGNGQTYIYMAFAEDPVKYSNGVATLGDGNEFVQDGNYPEDNFATETYTGNGGTQSISSLNFKPDLVWTKSRDGSRNHNLVDSVRGIGTNVYKGLASDLIDEENDPTNNISSLDSNGFTITGGGTRTNVNGEDYVAWSWKAGGLINKSAEFNGSSSKVQLPQTYGAEGETFSYSFWFNTSTNASQYGDEYMISKRNGNNTFHIRINTDGTIALNNWIGSGTLNTNEVRSSSTYTDGNWHHFVFTYDGNESTKSVCYIDGSRDASMDWTYNLITQSISNGNVIGDIDIGGRAYKGKLDQVRIFNKTLSTNNGGTNEIEKLYNETAADLDTLQILGDTSCVAAYKLGEDAIDLSGNYNGTASNVTFEKPGHLTRNNKGTIESEVSANQTNGFSIAKYTGSGTADSTVGHGLSKPPEIIIVKDLDNSDNWMVKVPSIMTDDKNYLYLNEDAEIETAGSTTFIKDVLSNTFTLGSSGQTNTLNDEYIAYCWHSVPGFSKIGSYTGSDDEVDVYTGFEPAWVMIKNTDSSGANWVIFDNKRDVSNPRNAVLIANIDDDESDPSTAHIDIFSNKFQINDSTSYSTNRDNDKYIYMAFAHR